MKRSPLKRTSSLKRTAPLARKALRKVPLATSIQERLAAAEVARAKEKWKTVRRGPCAVCGRRQLIIRHHVVLEQHIRAAGGDPWDLRNSMDIGEFCRCHANHHSAVERIAFAKIPDEAVAFAIDLYGEAKADWYLERYYKSKRRPA